MNIHCPYCKAQARIPESKEGAKVRCGECGKVYTARRPGAGGGGGGVNGVQIGIGVGALILGAIVLFFVNKNDTGAAPPPVVVEEEPEPEEAGSMGWDAESVKAVRAVYDSAYTFNKARLEKLIHPAELVAYRMDQGAEDAPAIAFESMSTTEKDELLQSIIEELTDAEGEDSPAVWNPFDGEVVLEEDLFAVVRVKVSGREGDLALETRTMEWKLSREDDGSPWRVWSWERWFSEQELKNARVKRQKEVTKVTLSDGSKVLHAEPRPLEHLPDTPEELRKEIDRLYAELIDLELPPRTNAKAKAALVEIGKPSLPILLTGMYEIPIETEEEAIQVNLINQCLEEITGNYTGYKPQVAEGSSAGTTLERRDSAIKQWFAWWLRKGERKFTEKVEGEDALEAIVEPTERDKRQMELDRTYNKGKGGG